MPNWSFNTVAVKGNKESVINFLNQALKNEKSKNLLSSDMSEDEMLKVLTKQTITLRSWLPMPKTYTMFDTTNSIENFDTWRNRMCGMGWNVPCQEIIEEYNKKSEEELKTAYDKYVEDWNTAKAYQEKKYGVVGWYDYNLKTLGTKWDAKIEQFYIDEYDDKIVVRMYCETAWSLPESWLNTMQRKNKDLDFFCYAWEESYAYNGYFAVKDTDWVENEDDIYGVCTDELTANGADSEDSEILFDTISNHLDAMYMRFCDYVYAA